jgi:hypothetical protein
VAVNEHVVAFPVQRPPPQLRTDHSVGTVTVRVTAELKANDVLHVPGHWIPAGWLETTAPTGTAAGVPSRFWAATVNVMVGSWRNVAVTARGPAIETEQLAPLQAPLYPAKPNPVGAVAVSVTAVLKG